MDKYVTSSALKKTIDLTKEELQDKDTRLSNIENSTPTTLTCENVITTVPANVQNNLKLTSVQGQTLQNLYPDIHDSTKFYKNQSDSIDNDGWITLTADGSVKYFIMNPNGLLKPSTQYTLIVEIATNTLEYTEYGLRVHNFSTTYPDYFSNASIYITNETGIQKYLLTTLSDLSSVVAFLRTHTPTTTTSGSIKFRMMLLEGDWTNKEVPPYFEGIQSVQNDIDVQITGKNLFDSNLQLGMIASGNGQYTSSTDYYYDDKYHEIMPNTNYKLQLFDNTTAKTIDMIFYYDENKNYIGNKNIQKATCNFTTISNAKYFRYRVLSTSVSDTSTVKTMLSYGFDNTEYEPYKQPINFTLPNEYELRSLPNGVKDEIKDGKLIKRVGKVVLNGSETWNGTTVTETGYSYFYSNVIDKEMKIYKESCLLCDTFLTKNDAYMYGESANGEIIGHGDSGGSILRVSTLKATTSNDWKTWLSNNNVTVLYELLEPEIIDLEPAIYNNPIIQAYTNGNIILNNSPIHPMLTFEYNTGLQGKINQVEIELQENQNAIREMVTNVTGEQIVNERVNDLIVQDTNIKLENLKGNTVQNLALGNHMAGANNSLISYTTSNNSITVTLNEGFASNVTWRYFLLSCSPLKSITTKHLLKPSTTYTAIFDVENSFSGDVYYSVRMVDGGGTYKLSGLSGVQKINKTGKFVQKFVTNDSSNFIVYDEYFQGMYVNFSADDNSIFADNGTMKISNVMVLEGDWTGKEIPSYFIGIKSVNEEQTGLSVKSVGKNLFNIESLIGKTYSGVTLTKDNDGWYVLNGTCTGSANFQVYDNYLKSGNYTLSANNIKHNSTDYAIVQVHSPSGAGFLTCNDNKINSTATVTLKESKDYLFRVRIENGKVYNNYKFKPQLEMNSTATEYEPYKESTITIPYTEPLRKLPNGICDEVVNGKVIRKVGKVVFDGTETFSKNDGISENDNYLYAIKLEHNNINDSGLSSYLLHYNNLNNMNSDTTKGFCLTYSKTHLYINFYGMISTNNNTNVKTYLQSNPLTIYYELATPIIEEIPEITLAGYKYLIFNNDIVPIECAISYANSMISRLKALEDSNVSHSKTIADLCAVVDFLTLQVGTLTSS